MYIPNSTLYSYSATAAQAVNATASSTNPSDETGEACGLIAYLYALAIDASDNYGTPLGNEELAEIQRVIGLLQKLAKDVNKFDPTIGALVNSAITDLNKPLNKSVLDAFWNAFKPMMTGPAASNPILNWMASFIPSSSAGPDVLFSYLMFTRFMMMEYADSDQTKAIEKLFSQQGGSIFGFANDAAFFLCAYVDASPDKAALGAILSEFLIKDSNTTPGAAIYNEFVNLFNSAWSTWAPPAGKTIQQAEADLMQAMLQMFQNQN